MIRVGIVNISLELSKQNVDKLIMSMSPEKKKQIEKFHFEEDKKRCLFGEILFRVMLWKQYDLHWKDIKIGRTNYGKPEILNQESIYFNISHSSDYVCCIISDDPVGIDIEKVSLEQDLSVFRNVFTQQEEEYIFKESDGEEKHQKFYRLWTLKESYIKKIGLGLSISLKSFNIVFNENRITVEDEDKQKLPEIFYQFLIDEQYYVSVCSEKKAVFSPIKYSGLQLLREYMF
ncbi:4'-phosphopantetheinyl transferase family protein [Candidatus Enterococcus mansonii]|uniref:Uncharacterized protein n=1 Tax=Candidatus Enterococcus mansonii TaxID=1834181 RepID=A0A242CIK2_9ENTE|nr:4'-phosphopantetheinyl transferase superfamily protein [Enterococcus sp. 4G2_DIV0659]OTO10073.1 hypothetical protein A5880_000756 [Enterococcus sp. 4G2_DIV0659]